MIEEVLVAVLTVYALWNLVRSYRGGFNAIGTHKRYDLPMVERGHPFIGNLVTAITRSDFAVEYFTVMSNQGIRWATASFPYGIRTIDISRPEVLEYVQVTNFANYEKGAFFKSKLESLLGNGIFVSDAHGWYSSRKALSKVFTAGNFKTAISDAIEHDIVVLSDVVTKKAGVEFDLSDLFFQFTLSSFLRMGFGCSTGFGNGDNVSSETDAFSEAFDYSQAQLLHRIPNPLFAYTERITSNGRKLKKAFETIDSFVYQMVDTRMAAGMEAVLEGKDILSLIVNLRDENGEQPSRTEIRDHVLNVIIAGRDTTAQGLSWLFFRLIQTPGALDLLRKEVDDFGSDVTYENHKDYVYCFAAWNEALRLHPPVSKNMWQAVADDQIPNGPKIYKGEFVRWSDWQMARDTTIWGEDASEFLISRWITTGEDGKPSLINVSQFKFHVFNAGPRHCIGMQLANFEAISVIVALIKNFDLQFASDYLSTVEMQSIVVGPTPVPLYGASLTLPMKEPLRVVATPRKG